MYILGYEYKKNHILYNVFNTELIQKYVLKCIFEGAKNIKHNILYNIVNIKPIQKYVLKCIFEGTNIKKNHILYNVFNTELIQKYVWVIFEGYKWYNFF
jgi:hypothetical protein